MERREKRIDKKRKALAAEEQPSEQRKGTWDRGG
jgi:hypothetical protein